MKSIISNIGKVITLLFIILTISSCSIIKNNNDIFNVYKEDLRTKSISYKIVKNKREKTKKIVTKPTNNLEFEKVAIKNGIFFKIETEKKIYKKDAILEHRLRIDIDSTFYLNDKNRLEICDYGYIQTYDKYNGVHFYDNQIKKNDLIFIRLNDNISEASFDGHILKLKKVEKKHMLEWCWK